MGKEKAFLTYDDINQELPEGLVSPDDIEDIFATLSGEGITISDSEEKFLETATAAAVSRNFSSESLIVIPSPLNVAKMSSMSSGETRPSGNSWLMSS